MARSTSKTDATRGEAAARELAPLEHLPVVAYVEEIDDDGAIRVSFATEQYAAVTGYPREEFGDDAWLWDERVHPDDLADYQAAFDRLWREREPLDASYRFQRGDGEWIWLQDTATAVYDATRATTVISGVMFDVTTRRAEERETRRARRAAASALEESEANYRSLFDSVDDIVLVSDLQGRVQHANAATFRLLGYEEADLRGMRILDLHPPQVREEAERIITAMFEGRADACHLPLLTAAGDVLPTETRIWHGSWNGEPCIFGMCRDLTAEREALQRFDRVFRANPALMAVNDMDGDRNFVDVNDAFLTALGYERDEVIGKSSADLDLFPRPDDQLRVAAQLREAGHVRNAELSVRAKDGRLLDGVFSGELIESQGKTYFLTVMVDETGRRLAEEEATELGERFRLAAHAAGFGVWDYDLTTGDLRWDESMLRLYGLERASFAGAYEAWSEALFPDDRQRAEAELQGALRGERDFDTEFRITRPNGDVRYIQAHAAVIRDSQGDPLRMTGVNYDVTERRLAEAQVKQLNTTLERRVEERTNQLEVANRELRGFVNSVAHDLRGPLRTIGSFGQILEIDHGDELGEEGADALHRILRANARMERLIDALLDLSGLTHRALRVTPTDLTALAREVADDQHEAAPDRRVEVTIEEGIHAPVDPVLARILFDNLLDNAWKFTARRKMAHVEVGCRQVEGEAIFYVRDDGAGFDQRYAGHLFSAFERLHSDAEFSGTGIGLATVKRIVERHGGRVWASGEVGSGATFFFTLPSGATEIEA